MPNPKFSPKNTHGFTIIEILVVVAIMAILAGISIPQYQKMVNKGNQQGAVAGLTSIYMAEKNYAAENHTYTSCISKIGVTPQPGARWYTMGFSSGNLNASCGSDPAVNTNCTSFVYDEGAPIATCLAGTDDRVLADRHNNLSAPAPTVDKLGTLATDMSRTTFRARAMGQIGSASAYDRWEIDQNGTPTNTVNNI